MGTTGPRIRPRGLVALTGTPGTGKSAVGRRLAAHKPVVEVADLAIREGCGQRRGRSVDVDLVALGEYLGGSDSLSPETVVVGHLAHLLPIRDTIVLRCRPDVLVRRLRTAQRGSAADRRENFLAEALDVVLSEAVALRRRVWEVDTTKRSIPAVAAEVEALIARRPRPRAARVDWLADRRVAAHLLDPPA
jgi:adenylate kinase